MAICSAYRWQYAAVLCALAALSYGAYTTAKPRQADTPRRIVQIERADPAESLSRIDAVAPRASLPIPMGAIGATSRPRRPSVYPMQRLPRSVVGVGAAEYSTFFLTPEGDVYALGSGNSLGELGLDNNGNGALTPALMQFSPGIKITQVMGGLHQSIALDSTGRVWVWGGFLVNGNPPGGGSTNRARPFRIVRDAQGNPFDSVVSVYAGGKINAAIKADGSLWVWGDATGGLLADGTAGGWTEYPTRVVLPSAAGAKQFSQGYVANVLMNDGNVYSWGGGGGYQSNRDFGLTYTNIDSVDYTRPQQVTFPAGSGKMNAMAASGSGARIFLNDTGQLYGFGYHGELLGQGSGSNNVAVNLPTPKRIDADLGFAAAVSKIAASNTAFFAVLGDGSLWAWGDAAQGEVGNGQGTDWAHPYDCQRLGTCGVSNPGGGGGPYKSSWGVGEWIVLRATRLLPNAPRITGVFSGNAAAYYAYAVDANGQLYAWGRNKTGNLGNGVYPATSTQAANLPNSWDVPLATMVNPLGLRTYRCTVSPFCTAYPTDASCGNQPADSPCPPPP